MRTRKTFALFGQVTAPRTTEDGETWLKDTSGHRTRTTSPVQPATQALPQIGMDAGGPKSARLVAWKVTTQENAEPDGIMNFGVPDATGTTTATIPAGYPHDAPPHPGTWFVVAFGMGAGVGSLP